MYVFANRYLLLSTRREGRFWADLFSGMWLSGYLVSIFNGCECVNQVRHKSKNDGCFIGSSQKEYGG